MKRLQIGFALAAVLVIAIAMNRNAKAQRNGPVADRAPLGEFEQLVIPLLKRGESNTVAEIASIVSSMYAVRDATDIGVTVRVLESLRSGRTNDAIRLLEIRLNGALMTFAPPSDGKPDARYAKILKAAQEYRAKYPHTSGDPMIDTGGYGGSTTR